jgi:hypothetical protein
MNHLTEEDLVLYHYGETPEPAVVEDHLARCERCRAERDGLAKELGLFDRLAVPERDETYGGQVWRRLRPLLSEPEAARRPFFAAFQPWLLATSLAALLFAAFLAGRFWPRAGGAALGPAARERILLVAVGDHLDRSQMILLEFVNADPSGFPGGDARERQAAEELVGANRLYRQTATHAGDSAMASALDDLERVLLEIAHSPSPEARQALRRRIESEGTIFKVRVITSRVREREKAPARAAARS